MKKKYIYIVVTFVIALFILLEINTKNQMNSKIFKIDTMKKSEGLHLYYELDDKYIYIHNLDIKNLKIKHNNETNELSEFLKNDKNFINELINNLEKIKKPYLNARDGGSKLYTDGNIDVLVCDTYDKNKNIYIGERLKDKLYLCTENKKQLVKEKAPDDKVVRIIQKASYADNIMCNSMFNPQYEDEENLYGFDCPNLIVVEYTSGYEEKVSTALENGDITINDLEKNGIKAVKMLKNNISSFEMDDRGLYKILELGNRTIFSSSVYPKLMNNGKSELIKEFLPKTNCTYECIFNYSEPIEILKDGGTKVFEYTVENVKYYLVDCHKLKENNVYGTDILIGKDKNKLENLC